MKHELDFASAEAVAQAQDKLRTFQLESELVGTHITFETETPFDETDQRFLLDALRPALAHFNVEEKNNG